MVTPASSIHQQQQLPLHVVTQKMNFVCCILEQQKNCDSVCKDHIISEDAEK